ncbi:MAG: cyanophycin synthetase [Patescibacteria group bacterium]
MKKLTQYTSAYLVGIKGVGMASLAECLLDAGLKVRGSDVAEEFVTGERLDELKIEIDQGFDHVLPKDVDLVIYTGAHQASSNPQVIGAKKRHLPTLCHAQALAELFNHQSGIAVCGVGGKSSVSAMLAWALTKLDLKPSFCVGVGRILGLEKIGAYNSEAAWFVAEADEYAANPLEVYAGQTLIPRFAYLKPQVIICTNLKFDHPDVYRDFAHTRQIFKDFFLNLKPKGTLIVNADDAELIQITNQVKQQRSDIKLLTFGEQSTADTRLLNYTVDQGRTISQVIAQSQPLELNLRLPGKFQVFNTLAALTCLLNLSINPVKVVFALTSFKSTQRRLELVGQDKGVTLYDDYAHHPHEIKAVFDTLAEMYSPQNIVVAFQPHTFSRTKYLFQEFVQVLSQIPRLVLMDIFPSAREAVDYQTTSLKLLEAVKSLSPEHNLSLVKNQDELYTYYQHHLGLGDVFITLGAGNIYQVFDLIGSKKLKSKG